MIINNFIHALNLWWDIDLLHSQLWVGSMTRRVAFLSGKRHLSFFLARHLILTTTLRQRNHPYLNFIRQKLTDLLVKR